MANESRSGEPVKVFICYSHKDKEWLDRLHTHLAPLEDCGLIEAWDDTRIEYGGLWADEIEEALRSAKAAVLMISARFLASAFIRKRELPALLANQRSSELKILPIVVSPCRMDESELSKFQALNRDEPLVGMTYLEQEQLFTELAETLSSLVGKDLPKMGQSRLWIVPYNRNPYFSGRSVMLERVRLSLKRSGVATLNGLGGVGKTQTAVEYAYRHRSGYRCVFWARAADSTTLYSDFAEIANLLKLAEAGESDQTRTFDAVLQWLTEKEDWLLILDNLDDPEQFERVAGNRLYDKKRHILITSRRRDISQSLGIVNDLNLEPLTVKEAVDFLTKRAERHVTDKTEKQAAAEIAEKLSCLPLALEQASAYITANQSRFQDYLKGYKRRQFHVLYPPRAGDYHESVRSTWKINFSKVEEEPPAAELLRLCAFLHAERIPLELIAKGAQELGPIVARALAKVEDDPLLLDEALEPLARYSLIRRDIEANTFSLHRIMQDVLKNDMTEEDHFKWAQRTLKAIALAFPKADSRNWHECERLLPQAKACVDLVKRFKDLRMIEAADLSHEAGVYLRKRAEYKGGTQFLTFSLEIREEIVGENHPSIAGALNSVAALYREQGLTAEAKPLAARARQVLESAREPDPLLLAKVLTTQAWLLRDERRWDDATKLCFRALSLEESTRGPNHPGLAVVLTSLAELHRMQNRYEEAREFITRAVKLDKQDDRQPGVAFSLTVLGLLHQDQQQYSEAEPLLQKALEVREQALGAFHPHVVESIENYARLLTLMKRDNDANMLLKRAQQIRARTPVD